MRQGGTIWLTGMSGAGKTTVATLICANLAQRGLPQELLDGDVVREHLSQGLGFEKRDRDINVHRMGWVCEILTRHGIYVCAAAISPYDEARREVRQRIGRFVLVHCTAPLAVLENRDVKGLYRRARAGEIKHFTGIDDPYEVPADADVIVHSDGRETPAQSAARVMSEIERRGLI